MVASPPILPAPALAATPPELWVLDATALLFRAYYGMRPRSGLAGEPVGAVLGLGQLLLQVLRRTPARWVALVYDAGRLTFRNRIDPRYKAQRGEPPPDLVPQFDMALALGQALGFAVYSVPDFEADDLMATLAREARAVGAATRLVSVDKDVCQLVRDAHPATVVEDPRTGQRCDAAGVRTRIGVPPERVVDFLALTGDSSDNIPGVAGVGPRAAVALLEAFDSLEAIYSDLGHVERLPVRGAVGLARKLEAGRDEAFLARSLVRLCDTVPLTTTAPTVGDPSTARRATPAVTPTTTILDHTRWPGPADDAAALFSAWGAPGAPRGFYNLRAALD